MAFTSVTVTHQFRNIDGTPASGTVVFRLTKRITNGAESYDQQIPVHASLDAEGNLSQVLPANDDPATTPADSRYQVTFMLNGQAAIGDEYSIIVPHAASGGTIDLGSLLPQQVGA